LPFALWATLIEFYGWICPLTPLENYLRLQSGAQGYEVGFIEHYLSPIIYPPGLTPEIQIGLGVVVLIVNLTIYTFVLTRWKNRSK